MEKITQYYEIIKEIVEEDEINDEQQFEDFAEWDSLSALSLIANLGETFGVVINASTLERCNSIGKLREYLVKNINS